MAINMVTNENTIRTSDRISASAIIHQENARLIFLKQEKSKQESNTNKK